jgi:hypothetical protein
MISYVTDDGVYFSLIAGAGGPTTLHCGHRFNPIYSEAAWKKALEQEGLSRTGFACNRCHAPVLANQHQIQLCRCARVSYAPGHRFRTGEQWAAWQSDFDEQLKDPAPSDYWIEPPNSEGVPQGEEKIMTPEAKTWVLRKLGLPPGVQLSDDGNAMRLPGVQGTLSVSAKGNMVALGLPDDADALEFCSIIQQIHAVRESPPQAILVVGDDLDYVWPLFTNHRLIRGLPFSCSRCGQRVKQAPVGTGELLVCFCLQAIYPPKAEKRPPRTRHEWDRLRLECAAETTRARARTAGTGN